MGCRGVGGVGPDLQILAGNMPALASALATFPVTQCRINFHIYGHCADSRRYTATLVQVEN